MRPPLERCVSPPAVGHRQISHRCRSGMRLYFVFRIFAAAAAPHRSQIDLSPIQVGGQNPGVVQVEGVDREDIPIKHDEVGTLALLQTARGVLLLQGERGMMV